MVKARKYLAIAIWVALLGYFAVQLARFAQTATQEEWRNSAFALFIVFTVLCPLFALDSFARRRGLGEARFDSKTGKQIKND